MPNRTGYVYNDIFLDHELEPGHPESPYRLAALHAVISESGLLNRLVPIDFSLDKEKVAKQIARVHTAEHIAAVRACGITGDVALHAVAGILAAVDKTASGEVDNSFCALRPPGHHAHNNVDKDGRGKGEGFCFFNNVAVAARHAQSQHGLKNILIIDWDYHHGNGTEDTFYDDPTVFYFSTHRLHAYPGTGYPLRIGEGNGVGYNLNVPLPAPENPAGRVGDNDLIAAFEQRLVPQLHKTGFTPDIILISAGFDSREHDFLGDFSITDEGFSRITELAVALARETCNGRIVSALEGGYAPEGVASAGVAHVKALLGKDTVR
ncbi:MAG: histone deacetylase [Chitinispirillaceae bacterium]|jgi:acetoin utilization deacetylase AcuC-like enzyme|nr:histone deacetylase [Chitinispirillaceae bacterium]